MESSRRLYPLAALVLIVGLAGFSHFSGSVRTVDAVGLSGAGFALGIGFALFALTLTRKIRA